MPKPVRSKVTGHHDNEAQLVGDARTTFNRHILCALPSLDPARSCAGDMTFLYRLLTTCLLSGSSASACIIQVTKTPPNLQGKCKQDVSAMSSKSTKQPKATFSPALAQNAPPVATSAAKPDSGKARSAQLADAPQPLSGPVVSNRAAGMRGTAAVGQKVQLYWDGEGKW